MDGDRQRNPRTKARTIAARARTDDFVDVLRALLRELRKLPEGDSPLVIFCTTENDMAHIQEALAAGANEYIMKPFDSEIIETKFSQIGLL